MLLALSFVLGYLTDMALTEWDKHRYPTEFAEQVSACAEQYDLDEYVIYALIKELSDFSSNRVSEDGRIGLMQLSEETFLWLTQEQLRENLDAGLLYEPSTNIRYGCYYLLYLTTRYESWDLVFAAYLCGTNTVEGWLEDFARIQNESETPMEFEIPDRITRRSVEKIQRTIDKYQELYQQKGDVTL